MTRKGIATGCGKPNGPAIAKMPDHHRNRPGRARGRSMQGLAV